MSKIYETKQEQAYEALVQEQLAMARSLIEHPKLTVSMTRGVTATIVGDSLLPEVVDALRSDNYVCGRSDLGYYVILAPKPST